jgi:hypothetical protein
MNFKDAFTDYVERLGYEIWTMNETSTGIHATILVEHGQDNPKQYFTQADYNSSGATATAYKVYLSYKDFENEAITQGFMQTECDHSDSRKCQGLGH